MTASPTTPARHVRLHLHGYPEVMVNGSVAPLRLKRALALLAYLSEQARPVGREALAALLWPNAAAEVARARLRRLVHEMHSAIGQVVVEGDGDAVWLAPDWTSDVSQTQAAASATLAAEDVDAAALAQLTQNGASQLLNGFTLDAEPFNDWLDEWRRAHAAQVAGALDRAAENARRQGQSEFAEQAAAALLRQDACSEQGHIARIAARALRGDQAGVEAAYFECAGLLRTEFGVRPSARVESAYAKAMASLRSSDVEIRYARTSLGNAAYATWGQGASTIVVLWGMMSNLEVALDEPRARRLLDALAERHRVVLLDRRGTGLAERIGVEPTADSAVEDIEATLDDLGVERAWLFGLAVGGTLSLDFALRRPERTAGLLLYGTSPTGSWSPEWPWAIKPQTFDAWVTSLTDPAHYDDSLQRFAPSVAADPWVRNWYGRLLRNAATHIGVEAVLRAYFAMDLRSRLGELRTPTLVLQRRGDRVVPFEGGRQLARAIPGATFEALEGDDHFLWHGDSDAVLAAVERFISVDCPP